MSRTVEEMIEGAKRADAMQDETKRATAEEMVRSMEKVFQGLADIYHVAPGDVEGLMEKALNAKRAEQIYYDSLTVNSMCLIAGVRGLISAMEKDDKYNRATKTVGQAGRYRFDIQVVKKDIGSYSKDSVAGNERCIYSSVEGK